MPGQGLNIFKGNIGEVNTDGGPLSILKNESVDQFAMIRATYEESETEQPQAFYEKHGGVPGTYSIFNPFKIFRYSKFGLNGDTYEYSQHLDGEIGAEIATGGLNRTLGAIGGAVGSVFDDAIGQIGLRSKPFTDQKKSIENPTASEIIKWALNGNENGAFSAVPYTASDFLWCKYYGKVPNNRMLTLRRYAMPIEDNLLIHKDKGPLVPVAQAITWYGEDLGNSLTNVLNLSWGLKWDTRSAKVQDIAGNEISVDDIAKAVGLSGPENKKLVEILKSQIFSSGDTVDILKLSGYDVEVQNYIKQAYSDDGPYWNRILGPVNAIDRTLIRDRGFPDQQPIKLIFEYSLRAYGGVNPKIAFLDLLSNFLSLTYNNAPFWGGGVRYFQKTGVTVPGLAIENEMLKGDVYGGIQAGLTQMANQANQNLEELVNLAKNIKSGAITTNEDIENARADLDKRFQAGPVEKILSQHMGEIMKKPLIYRAVLDGRAVGEWHLAVGNPMNPIAMIGNLCLDSVKMDVGDTLGIDDFPTEFKFTVTLKHGRPRAKQDIESMFNLGNGAMGFSELPQPSSAQNSYGENTSKRLNNAYGGDNDSLLSKGNIANVNFGTSHANDNTTPIENGNSAGAQVWQYTRQVRRLYGSVYGNSPILTDYFKDLKTKD